MGTVNTTISPAIAGVYITLYDKTLNTCQTLTTDSLGKCTFSSLPAGNYSLYNVGIAPNACPPTACGYPKGYTGTTTPRREDFSLTAAGTVSKTFRYDTSLPWNALNGGNPPTYAITTIDGVDLATGQNVTIPTISNNGMGYCMQDNFIYGSSGRTAADGNDALSYPAAYTTNGLIGDCDDLGYFYSPAGANVFTCINVNSYSPGFLRACNPYNGFQETTAPYYVSYTPVAGSALSSADWSYVPNMQSLVGIDGTEVFILSLTTPKAYSVPVIGTPVNHTGISFADNKNFYEPSGTQIKKFYITPTVAIGTVLSTSSQGIGGDGCRAVGAPVYYAEPRIVKKVDKNLGVLGDTLIYTVTIVNAGVTPALTSVFKDTLPTGVEFVADSMYLNGVQKVGETPNNLNIGSLPVGTLFTITFNGKIGTDTIVEFPNMGNIDTSYYDSATEEFFYTNFESNIVVTTIIKNYVSTTKTVDKNIGKIGDILTYTVVTANLGVTIATGVVLIDTIPSGTSLVSGSFKVNGITISSGSILPPGYSYGNLGVGGVITSTFKVQAVSLPNGTDLINFGTSAYTSVTPFGNVKFFIDSNTVVTKIKYADFSNINKRVDKAFSKPGDTIEYTIVIPNTGNTDAIDVFFTDTIPNGTSFVSGSLFIDSLPSSETFPVINLGVIKAGDVKTISYKVLIN